MQKSHAFKEQTEKSIQLVSGNPLVYSVWNIKKEGPMYSQLVNEPPRLVFSSSVHKEEDFPVPIDTLPKWTRDVGEFFKNCDHSVSSPSIMFWADNRYKSRVSRETDESLKITLINAFKEIHLILI